MPQVVENPESIKVEIPSNPDYYLDLNHIFHPISKLNALLILNQQITIPNFLTIWKNYNLKLCADGGANRLFDYFDTEEERLNHLPDVIIGDFDSLRDDVRDWYRSHGVRVIRQRTQYATDLGKCLDFAEIHYEYLLEDKELDHTTIDDYDGIIKLHQSLSRKHQLEILITGGIDGRFDHTVQSINILTQSIDTPLNIHFITSTDLIILIKKGQSVVESQGFHSWNCGLLPLIKPVKLTTEGLKWDVTDWESYMSGNVSSSNRIVGDERFIVGSDGEFILSVELDYKKLNVD